MRLTPTSYIVLGLIEWAGEATPYDLKRSVEGRIGNFWSIPHSQLYREPGRLAAGGYLRERREPRGRRRRRFALTERGRAALERWRDEPDERLPELRDLGLLKLFFGGDPARLAPARLAGHERKLREYRELLALAEASGGAMSPGPARTLRAGIGHERVWVEYWRGFERA